MDELGRASSAAREQVRDVELQTGYHNYGDQQDEHPPVAHDFQSMTKELTIASGEFAHVELVCKTNLQFLATIQEALEFMGKDSAAIGEPEKEDTQSRMLLRLRFIRGQLEGIQNGSVYVQQRIQAQVQTVRILFSIWECSFVTRLIDLQPHCSAR